MDITMPQLGETVTEGTITKWLKKVGDRVEVDEPLFEVSTDKVDSEVPAPASGFVAEILVPEGDTVEVGVRLAVLSETAPAPGAASAPTAPPRAAAPPAIPSSGGGAESSAPTLAPATQPPVPVAPAAPTSAPVARSATEATVMSPIVRRLIAERGLDPAAVKGTGEGGRITRRDVLTYVEAQPSAPVLPPTSRAAATTGARTSGDEVVAFDNIRRRTAEHMVRSKATSAHVYTSIEVDFERVDRVRRAHGPTWKESEGYSLTYLPFVVRAFCDAVDEYPNVNASVDGDSLVVHHDVHLAIAVDLDFRGLVAPVVRDASGKRIRLLAREIHDLAERARSKQLMPDDVLGGTFTITNMGPFGTTMTLPIINQPQVAILATDAVQKRPVAVEGPDGDDAVAVHPVGMLTLTWDHRAFDGAYAASFLREMKEIIEHRDWEAELA